MGIVYETAPLHTLSYVDFPRMVQKQPDPSSNFAALDKMLAGSFGTPIASYEGPPEHVRIPVATILSWRQGINDRYNQQLGEELCWPEDSEFSDSEDLTGSGPVMLEYVAAVLDQLGFNEAARRLLNRPKPFHPEMAPVFDEARRRKSSRFPQILLGVDYWLPFQRQLIIEEPDWRGDLARFGSIYRLAEELEQVRQFISDIDPNAAGGIDFQSGAAPTVMASAWTASGSIRRICQVATTERLPMWVNA